MYQGGVLDPPDNTRGNGFNRRTRPSDPPPDYGGFTDTRDQKNGASTESLDSTGKTKSFKRLVERFAEKTSMQGVPYINSSKFWYAKLLWTILLLSCTAGMTLHLYYLINQFLQWPIQTKIELGFSNLNFPAVTICNVNPIRNSKVYMASEHLQSLLAELEMTSLYGDDNAENSTKRRRKRFVDELSNVNTSGYDNYKDGLDYDDEEFEYGSDVDFRVQIMELFTHLYREEDRDVKIDMGHQLDQMLISCTIGKYKCYADNFTLLQHDTYGNCYTLQSNKLKISKSGPMHGLTLVMYMDKEEYLKQLNEGYGARLLIHDRNTFPFPAEEGFFVPSSSETQIGVRMVVIQRKGKPYGNCIHDHYTAKYGFKYTRPLCQTLCVQEKIFQKCGCYQEDSNELNWQINNKNLRYCDTRKEVICMLKEVNNQNKNKDNCQCLNPCKEYQYLKTISYRNWPTDDYMFTLKDGVCDRLPDQCSDAQQLYDQTDDFKKGLNYLKINIYYEDLNYEEIEETPEIETAQFASDVGGAIGLWIGLSFLSMFEVVQLFLECCAYGVHKCTNGNKKKNRRRKKNNKSNVQKQNLYSTNNDITKSSNEQKQGHYNPDNSKQYQGVYSGPYDYIDNTL